MKKENTKASDILDIITKKQKSLAFARLFCDRARIRTWDLLIRSELLYPAELRNLFYFLSGWQDSNLRPPAPKAGAITGLRYTPKTKKRRDRDSNPGDGYPSTD